MAKQTLALSLQSVAELWNWAESREWGDEARHGLDLFIKRFLVIPYDYTSASFIYDAKAARSQQHEPAQPRGSRGPGESRRHRSNHPRGRMRGSARHRQGDAGDDHPRLVLLGHLRAGRLLVRAVQPARGDGGAVRRPSGACHAHAVVGALRDGGLRRRHRRRRHHHAQRRLPRRHPPERRHGALPGLRGRRAVHLPRGARPLGRRRRNDPGQLLGPFDQHLPGRGPHPAGQALRTGTAQRRGDAPAAEQHATARGAARRSRSIAGGVPGGGGAHRTPRCEVRPGHRARLHRDEPRPLRAADARSHPRAARWRVRVRGLSRVL